MTVEYAFRVTGRLTAALMRALDPLEARAATTETLLVGHVEDQAELHGFIARIEALGLDLVELQRLPRRSGDRTDGHRCPSCRDGELANRAALSGTVSRPHP